MIFMIIPLEKFDGSYCFFCSSEITIKVKIKMATTMPINTPKIIKKLENVELHSEHNPISPVLGANPSKQLAHNTPDPPFAHPLFSEIPPIHASVERHGANTGSLFQKTFQKPGKARISNSFPPEQVAPLGHDLQILLST
jgi:hypothetical protein